MSKSILLQGGEREGGRKEKEREKKRKERKERKKTKQLDFEGGESFFKSYNVIDNLQDSHLEV